MKALTLEPRTASGNAGPLAPLPKKPRWAHGSRCPIAAVIAPKLGLSPHTVEKLMRLAPRLMAEAILEMKAAGDEKRLADFVEPVHRAEAGRPVSRLCEADWDLAQIADGQEDTDEGRYQRNPTPQNRARLIRSKREAVRRELALIDALEEEQRRGDA